MNNPTKIVLLTAALLLAALPATARDDPRDRRDRSPERAQREWGTARVGVAERNVEIRLDGQSHWGQARAAEVLQAGDAIRTGADSRAEIELDRFNIVRLGPETELLVHALGNRAYQLELVEGTLSVTQWDAGRAEVFIDSAELSFSPLKQGNYRLDALDEKTTIVTVRKGAAEVLVPGGAEKVGKGKRLTLTNDEGRYGVTSASGKDEFDQWVARRDDILKPPSRNRGWGPSYLGLGYGFGYPYYGYGRGFGYGGYSRVRVISRGRVGGRGRGRGRR